MSMEARIKAAVAPVVPEVYANGYKGDAPIYCTFTTTEIPDGFGNNRAHAVRYLVQLHLFLPYRTDPYEKKVGLRRAIIAAGFTTPTITNASDNEDQHYVFEFEGVDGDV